MILPVMSMIANIHELSPAASFTPETKEEVAAALRRARDSGLQVVVLASGHGLPAIGRLSGSLVLDMSRFDRVSIDPDTAIARIGGAVDWRRLTAEAARHALVGPFGTSATVGVAGYISGGGIGPMSRYFGLAANSVLAAEMVMPDGTIRRIDAGSDPDLFWAIRGGGGGFGVITELELRLEQIPAMSGGLMIWPRERSVEVVPAWAEWTATAPHDLTSSVRLVNLPGGRSMLMLCAAAPRQAASVRSDLAPLAELGPVSDTIADTDPVSFMDAYSDPDPEPDGPPHVTEHVLLDRFPAEAADEAVWFARPGGGAMMIEVRHLGGALARAPHGAGAQGAIDGEFSLFAMGPPDTAGNLAHAVDVLSVYGRGRTYFNFLTRRGNRTATFPTAVDRRLAELQLATDPDRLMNHPQPRYDQPPVASPDNRSPAGGQHRRRTVGAGS